MSHKRRALFGLMLVLTILPYMGGLTFANHTSGNIAGILGGFEIDGDYDFDGATIGSGTTATVATRDWANVGTVTTTVTMSPDTFGTSEGSSFKEGSKETEADNWVIEAHNVPGKDDLTRGYVAADITVGGQFLFLSFERMDVDGQGNVHVNFELNKSPDSIVNKEGTTIPERTDGDLLVVYDYAGGSNAVNIELRLWDGIADNLGTSQNEEALFGLWNLVSNVNAVGDVNFDGALTRPAAAPFGGGTVDTLRFGEAAIDLSAIPGFLSCPGFSQFYAKSRASGQSFDSALKDLTSPTPVDLSTCGSVKVLKEDDTGNALNGAVFELFNDMNNNNAFDAGDTLAQTCTTGEEATAGECTFEEVAPGEYVVKEKSAPLGYVLDPTVSAVTVRIREAVTVAHTFIDPKIRYRLFLTPPEDTNLVNNNHVFTASLEKSLDSGGTWVVAAGEPLGLSLAGSGSITSIVTGSITNSTSGSCTTSSSGACLITVRSPDPGRSTLTASFDKLTATSPIDLDTSALKDWVNYRVTLCCEATNLVETTHTFTAVLEQQTTNGGAWTTVPQATLAISKTAGVGSITSIQAGTVTSPTAGNCTTDSAGSCLIGITSANAGDTTIQAAYNAVVGDTSGTFSVTAVKHWVNYEITVAPDGVNLVGQPHTFTVTVKENSGIGFAILPGAPVTLGWSGVAGSAITSAVVGSVAPDGQSATCTTGSAGTCTVVVNSSAPGSGSLTATFSTVLDSGAATFPASATKQWVDYTITVTPEIDTNLLPVEPNHTFTVKLASTDPTLAPIAGQTVDLALASSVSTITAIAPSGLIDAGGMGGTCTTNSSGECTVTISTSGPGEATLTASFSAVVSSATLDLSDDGAKTWITYRITVTPEQATNLVGQPHTFTVKIESTDDGSVWDPVSGATPALSLTGVGSITGGTCGATNATGECTAIVSSSGTGVATLVAQYLATVGTASHTFSDTGTKTWINYQILVTPLEAANLVSTDHVFTVTAFKDSGDGNGFQPLAGVNPEVTIGGVGQISGNACDDPGGTSAAGQCTVTVTSAAAGLTTLTASFLGTADGASATFTSGPGTKQWVDYRLTVTPETAVNPVGTTHTFTITLETDTGTGFGPAAGKTVNLALSGLGTITQVPGGATAPDLRSASCTTDSSGQCTATITSAAAGESRLTATYGAVVGSSSRTFSDFGDKLWVTSSLSLVVEKTNDANSDGIFTDSETAPTEGATVTFRAVITNNSAVTLVIDSITDSWPGRVPFGVCSELIGRELAPGASATCTFTVPNYAPLATVAAGLTDIVDVQAHDKIDVSNKVGGFDTSVVKSTAVLGEKIVKPQVLPATGSNASSPALLAGVLILLGLMLERASRRRLRSWCGPRLRP